MLIGIDTIPVIPCKSNERLVEFDKKVQRPQYHRAIEWLNECRAVFAKFGKTATNYAGMIKMAFIKTYMKIILKTV